MEKKVIARAEQNVNNVLTEAQVFLEKREYKILYIHTERGKRFTRWQYENLLSLLWKCIRLYESRNYPAQAPLCLELGTKTRAQLNRNSLSKYIPVSENTDYVQYPLQLSSVLLEIYTIQSSS